MDTKDFLLLSRIFECIANKTLTEEALDALIESKPDSKEDVTLEEIKESTAELITEVEMKVLSLSDNPQFTAKVADENVICVSLCESIPDACGTAKINFMESTIFLNGCDYDGKTSINLDVEINGKMFYNTPFIVREDSSVENSLQIDRNILCNSETPSS